MDDLERSAHILEATKRVRERLEKAKADAGVFARFYAEDVDELLTIAGQLAEKLERIERGEAGPLLDVPEYEELDDGA